MADRDNSRGLNLREWRLRRGLTQEELAAEVFMSKGAIQGLENGRSPGSKNTWRRLARALDVEVAVLLAERRYNDTA